MLSGCSIRILSEMELTSAEYKAFGYPMRRTKDPPPRQDRLPFPELLLFETEAVCHEPEEFANANQPRRRRTSPAHPIG